MVHSKSYTESKLILKSLTLITKCYHGIYEGLQSRLTILNKQKQILQLFTPTDYGKSNSSVFLFYSVRFFHSLESNSGTVRHAAKFYVVSHTLHVNFIRQSLFCLVLTQVGTASYLMH